ncbi:unnamed protein product [Microthlaspi erraticum]|uniref:RING-type E3 ubiquitin transferase n=1 Tax=Microthlaspi erraticum TaxID=1685480 RepID=A0A6D2I8A6_9BRAS|nr:unnamed protein product [Microthlaspi erraticum]
MAEALNDDPVYVAVGKDVGESRLTLTWALRNLRLKKLYLVHVHQQISMNPTSSGLEQSEIDAIQESEWTSAYESLLKYRDICEDEGVEKQDVDIFCNLANNVGEGIVELIYENNIKKLIMGAAADSHYSQGMVNIKSRKAKYVSRHAPHCCKMWLVCKGNLIQTREGQFDSAGSSHASSESLSSLHGLVSALIPYEEAGRAEHDTDSHALSMSSPESQSARGFETMYYEEQRRRLEIEELKREKERYDKMKHEREESLSASFGVTQTLYNEEVSRRREAEEELNRARAEIQDMKRIQEELQDQLCLLETSQEERDEAIKTTEELLRLLNLEKGESSSHSPLSPLQWSLSNEPPAYFICPISKEIMQNPHVAADGYTYEAAEFRSWISHGGEKSPMTNLKLESHSLTPNLVLRSAINDWLQQHPYFYDLP